MDKWEPERNKYVVMALTVFSVLLLTIAFFLLEERGIAEVVGLALFAGLMAWVTSQANRK